MGSLGGIRVWEEGTNDEDAFEPGRDREKSRFGLMNC